MLGFTLILSQIKSEGFPNGIGRAFFVPLRRFEQAFLECRVQSHRNAFRFLFRFLFHGFLSLVADLLGLLMFTLYRVRQKSKRVFEKKSKKIFFEFVFLLILSDIRRIV